MKSAGQLRCATTLFAVALAVTGIARLEAGGTRHEVFIEALCREPAQGAALHSYLIRPRRPVFEEKSLRHKEAVAHLRTALSGLGLFEAPAGVRPDLVVEFDYGLGQPRTVYVEVTEPVYEVQGGTRVPSATGHSLPSGLATQVPDDARRAWVVGYAVVKRPVLVRDKYLAITVRANAAEAGEARPSPELWRVSARIEDSSEELRGYLPVLAAAVMDCAGATSAGNETLALADNSEAVAFIRRGL